jgi:integrase
MNTVDALSKTEIDQVSSLLLRRHKPIYHDVFKIGLQLSLRISDLLSLRYDQLDLDNRALTLVETKTGKTKDIRINNTAIEIIKRRRTENPKDVWLFQVSSNRSKNKPIGRCTVSRVFQDVAVTLGLNFNTHSLRKSRGKAMFDANEPIALISKVLNHSNVESTMRYLGISRKQEMSTFDDYEL